MWKPSGCVSVDFRGVSLSFFRVCHWLIFTFVSGFVPCSLLFALRQRSTDYCFPFSFFSCFFRHLHHLLFSSYKTITVTEQTHSHLSWIQPSCRQENKGLILLNDYNVHHFSICNHLHSVINKAKWVMNCISCNALWEFWRCLHNWVISGNKNGVKPSWRHFCQIKPEKTYSECWSKGSEGLKMWQKCTC